MQNNTNMPLAGMWARPGKAYISAVRYQLYELRQIAFGWITTKVTRETRPNVGEFIVQYIAKPHWESMDRQEYQNKHVDRQKLKQW